VVVFYSYFGTLMIVLMFRETFAAKQF